jgi:hypothetical protein
VIVKLGQDTEAGALEREDAFHWVLGGNSTVHQVMSRLGSVTHKVIQLHFDKQEAIRSRRFVKEPFPDTALQQGFMTRLKHLPGFWCCRQPNGLFGSGGTPYSPMILQQGIEHRG